MRSLAIPLAAALALSAVGDAAPERLDVYGIAVRAGTSRLRAAFPPPGDPAVRDLRDDDVTLRIGAEAPILFNAASALLRFNRAGTKLSYTAPHGSSGRVRKLRLSTAAGTLRATLGGAPLSARTPPVVELTLAGRLYRYVPPEPGDPPPDPLPPPDPPPPVVLPDGPLAFTTVHRASTNLVGTTTHNWAISDGVTLAAFTGSVSLPAAVVQDLQQTDFSRDTIFVAAGDAVGLGAMPFSVRIQSVSVSGGRIQVAYDKYWAHIFYEPPGIPVWNAGIHIVRVPVRAAPTDFVATPVRTQLPYQ